MKIKVDYSNSIKTLIKKGKYDWVNNDITDANFPPTKKGKEEFGVELYTINEYKSTNNIEKELRDKGLEPLGMTDLLHLGIQHPNEQRTNYIVALGSAWVDAAGYRLFGCLLGGARRRYCDLRFDDPGDVWIPRYVFAVRRRVGVLEAQDSDGALTLESLDARVRKLEEAK